MATGSLGGGAGFNGGGGGSFIAADFSLQMQDMGVNTGNGLVTINQISVTAPEPGSLALLASGLLGVGVVRRRRNRA